NHSAAIEADVIVRRSSRCCPAPAMRTDKSHAIERLDRAHFAWRVGGDESGSPPIISYGTRQRLKSVGCLEGLIAVRKKIAALSGEKHDGQGGCRSAKSQVGSRAEPRE